MRLALVTALLFAACAYPAQAAVVCSPNSDEFGPVALGSVDGDDTADLAVGLPAANEVIVEQTKGGRVELTGDGRFGAAVAIGDVDGDACADVVVGAPDAGEVRIFRGSPAGLQSTPLVVSGAGGFGAAVVITQDSGLWVGAPREERVERFTVSGDVVSPAATYTARDLVEGERFGAHLAPGGDGVYVGVPLRSHERGAVELVPVTGPHKVFTLPQRRRGDRFGAAVATTPSGGTAAAGAPGRGLVQVLGGRVFHRKGTRFGAALVYGRALTCQEHTQLAALSPGTRAVSVLSAQKGCTKRYSGVTAIGLVRGRDDFDEDIADALVQGTPGRLLLRGKTYLVPDGPQVIAVPQSGDALRA